MKCYEYKNPCSNQKVSGKRPRITELETLHADGHGGQIRRHVYPNPLLIEMPIVEGARSGDPDTYFESPCSDDVAVEQYQKIVLECSRLAETTSSPDVKAEGPGMIKKMRALLDPKLRSEIDFEEATQGCSNIFAEWSKGNCAGARAFIPGIVDRDRCIAALKIHACAVEEAKSIPAEYCEMFGEDGYWMYNQLIAHI